MASAIGLVSPVAAAWADVERHADVVLNFE
jgi:hypothetical protein